MGKARRERNSAIGVAYIRVSSQEQKLGPGAQRSAIEAWAKQAGVRIVEWVDDNGVSGGAELDARPGLMRALAALGEHDAGVLVVARRDRLARDVGLAIAIERMVTKSKSRIVSADGAGNGGSPADEFMRTVIDAAAAYERALIRARTKAALQSKRAKGLRAGEVPYGFRADKDGRLHPLEREQAIIKFVVRARRRGSSLRGIVRACERKGFVSRSGKPLGLTQIARLARRYEESST